MSLGKMCSEWFTLTLSQCLAVYANVVSYVCYAILTTSLMTS